MDRLSSLSFGGSAAWPIAVTLTTANTTTANNRFSFIINFVSVQHSSTFRRREQADAHSHLIAIDNRWRATFKANGSARQAHFSILDFPRSEFNPLHH
jgi:hypothetical protein